MRAIKRQLSKKLNIKEKAPLNTTVHSKLLSPSLPSCNQVKRVASFKAAWVSQLNQEWPTNYWTIERPPKFSLLTVTIKVKY